MVVERQIPEPGYEYWNVLQINRPCINSNAPFEYTRNYQKFSKFDGSNKMVLDSTHDIINSPDSRSLFANSRVEKKKLLT